MLDTFPRDFLQTLFDGLAKRRGDLNIEAASDECQSEWFSGQFGQPDANATTNAFAGLENDAARLNKLLKAAALLSESAGIYFIELRVRLERAIARRPAVTMQATGGFRRSF